MFPLERGGEFAADLGKCRQAALTLYDKLNADPRFMTAFPPQLDIVIFAPKRDRLPARFRSARARFSRPPPTENLHLALANFPQSLLGDTWPDVTWDQPSVTCLRSCLMKPEHLDWIERIWSALDAAAD